MNLLDLGLPILAGAAIIFFVIFCIGLLIKSFYIKVPQGTALIINTTNSVPKVRFTGGLTLPVIHKSEFMKISLITLEVDRRGSDGLICADNMRADITVAFYLRVNETPHDVLRVAKSIGVDRASDREAVYQLFAAKFSEALKTVGKQIEFVDLFENRLQFREKIVEVIGDDLNGYVLEDVAIDYLEQTPKSSLDASNILDAQGIRKITELTAQQNISTNNYEREEELAIKKKNVETREAMLELERQQADAEERQRREIASLKAREEAETLKVQHEERRRAELTSIEVMEELTIKEENKLREIAIAEQNRLRAIAIEEEKVIRARDMEIVSRNREVELSKIDADKAIEVEKKEIANIVRERIVVDKTVASEEEKIKELREVSAADREKQIQVKNAEGLAEEEKVKIIKQAEAEEQSAMHKSKEITLLAAANLESASKEADAKKLLAAGVQAELAAEGLAEAAVLEAKADSSEKEGYAMARVIEAKGGSEAKVMLEKLSAEAEGLSTKFDVMGNMSDTAREHEEYRMALETALNEAMASIEAGKEIAKENADVLAVALENAKIDIVGGDDHFFNNFSKALSMGKAIDGLTSKSTTVNDIIDKFLALGQSKSDDNTPATKN